MAMHGRRTESGCSRRGGLPALVLAGVCACLASRARAEEKPNVVTVSTPDELKKALVATDDNQVAEHILITQHLDLTGMDPTSSEDQPNVAETMFYLTPRTKSIRGECKDEVPDFEEEPKQLHNRKENQCVISTNLRLFEWSDGEPYKFWGDNLYVRHVPDNKEFPVIDMLYWNMKKIEDPDSKAPPKRGDDAYLIESRLYLTQVTLQSVKAAPKLDKDQAPALGVTGLYAEGAEVYLEDCEFRGLSGNALDVQAAHVSLKDTTLVDNVSWNHEDDDLIDGVIVLESSPNEERKGSVRMEGGKFEATEDNDKREDQFGSDVGALRVAAFYADSDDINVNKQTDLTAEPLADAGSAWASRKDSEFKALQRGAGVAVASASRALSVALAVATTAGAMLLF